jgi:tnpB family transposase
MSKHDLRTRPLLHHTRDATWTHPTAVTAALAGTRHLQNATGTTITRIVHELRGLQDVIITSTAAKSTPPYD